MIKQNDKVVEKLEKALNASNTIQEKRSIMLRGAGLQSGLSETEVLAVYSVLEDMILHVEELQVEKIDCNVKPCRSRKTSGMSWVERAQVCCFFYHQALGNKDSAFTSVVYGLNPITIKGWCTKSSMIEIWRDFAKMITVSHILNGLSMR